MKSTLDRPAPMSPRAVGRAIAVLFIVTIALGVIAQIFISDRLISFRDPAKTATAILANASTYRLGFTLYMIEMAAQMAMTVLFYHLLKPVNRRVAAIALVFGLVGCTIKTFSRVFYLVPLFVLAPGGVPGLGEAQLQALSMTLLTVNDRGAAVALAFFGLETVLEGWLTFHSTFLPRWLGAFTIVVGFGWMAFLSPTLGYRLFNIVAPLALVGAIATIAWLLAKGVDEQRWLSLATAEDVR